MTHWLRGLFPFRHFINIVTVGGAARKFWWKSWFSHRQVILKKVLLPISVRQQQPSSKNLAFLSTHFSLCCVYFGMVLRSVAVRLSFCS